MVPNINPRGQSFKGVTAYLMHDKKAATAERVGFTETVNMHTNDIEQASRYMAWLDMNRDYLRENNTGREAMAGNVYHFSLSWRPDEQPDAEHMRETAHKSVAHLGLEEHQYFMVEHTDEPQKHVHIVVNLVHPETGKIANVYRDQYVLDRWANDYELEHGIVCEERAEKYEQLEAGERSYNSDLSKAERKALYTEKASEIYRAADSGKAFVAGLESEGLSVANGRNNRLVIVDQQGEVYRATGLITGVKVKDIEKKYSDLDRSALPSADMLEEQRKADFEQWLSGQSGQDLKPDDYNREDEEAQQQQALTEAAERHGEAQAALENRAAELIKTLQIEIKQQAKQDWVNLKARHREDLQAKEQRLREIDSPKEAKARAYYQPLIDQGEAEKVQLEKINQGWFSRNLFRLRNGVTAAQELDNTQKSIDDAKSKLEANTGGLNRDDYRKLQSLRNDQAEQREALKTRIEKQLVKAEERSYEQAKLEQEHQPVLEAEQQTKNMSDVKREQSGSVRSSLETWEKAVSVDNSRAVVKRENATTKSPLANIPKEQENQSFEHWDFWEYYEERAEEIKLSEVSEDEKERAYQELETQRLTWEYEQDHSISENQDYDNGYDLER